MNNSINTFSQAKDLLNNESFKTLQPNVTLSDCGDVVELTYYNQTIAAWDKTKGLARFYLVKHSDGMLPRETINVINKFCPSLMRCSSSKSGTFLFRNGEKIQTL